jgi:serine protease AprX
MSPFPTVTNNVQQVVIAAPVAGVYTIRVYGVSVTQQAPGVSPGANPRQDFAVAVSNGMSVSVPPVSGAPVSNLTGSMALLR